MLEAHHHHDGRQNERCDEAEDHQRDDDFAMLTEEFHHLDSVPVMVR